MMNNFNGKMTVAKMAEQEIYNAYYRDYNWMIQDTTDDRRYFPKDIDFILKHISNLKRDIKVEVKEDYNMHVTGNILFEIEHYRYDYINLDWKITKGWAQYCEADYIIVASHWNPKATGDENKKAEVRFDVNCGKKEIYIINWAKMLKSIGLDQIKKDACKKNNRGDQCYTMATLYNIQKLQADGYLQKWDTDIIL